MATWKAYRIVDVITGIDEDRYVLPVIQRRLVWDEEKMELLFDTVLKGDSFGGIMVIEEEKDSKPLFSYRSFTKDGSVIKSQEVEKLTQLQRFVVDGQQRLQSFYIGLKGSINGKVLYFDLYSDFNSEFEFRFANNIAELTKPSKDIAERTVSERYWYSAKDLLRRLKDTNDDDQVVTEIIKDQAITDEIKKTHITRNVRAFYKNLITQETVGVSRVTVNKTFEEVVNRQKIVELFKRLNDGATKLSSFEIVASILKGYSWEMEGFLENTLISNEEIGLTQDNLIKLIFLLQDNHKKEMSYIEAKDAEFAINNKERIQCTLKSLKNFLVRSGLYPYYKEGNRSFIPLFFITYHLFHKKITNKDIESFFDNFDAGNSEFPKMTKWIYHSLLNGVFRSKGAGWIPYKRGIRTILEEIQNHKNAEFPVDKLFQVYLNQSITFSTQYDVANLDQLDSSFLFYLMYNREEKTRRDIDHIIPKSILEAKGYDWTKINSIRNFELLELGTNRWEKSAKPFKDWVSDTKWVKDKPSYLERHLIPLDESLWDENRFDDFLAERGKLIFAQLTKYVQ
ncbi:MAG: DUF262 domain-containing protein [Desulfomonilaceae bacterium]